MHKFTIYNPETKDIAGEFEFEDYIVAREFTEKNYPKGYISQYNPFNFHCDLQKMLKKDNPNSLKDKRGNIVALRKDGTIYHCGYITVQEWVNMDHYKIPNKQISKNDFINMVNGRK